MAQRIRNNENQSIINQENMHIRPKSTVMGPPPAVTKRSVLGQVGNNPATYRAIADRKIRGDGIKPHAPSRMEEAPVPVSKTAVRNKKVLKKAFSTSSIPKEITNSNLIGVEDIDKDDKGDPFLVPEYVNDIYAYLRELEEKYPIRRNYLEGQEITSKMRGVLVDWLVEVHQQFHLLVETLYLTVAIIDRYLQEDRTTTCERLQLVGVGAMFIASKYEEMFVPEVGDFVYICANAYTKDEILQMERTILQTLKFSISRPLPLHFLRRYSKVARTLPLNHAMAKYFLELCLVDYEMCYCAPSLISAAATYLALWLFRDDKEAIWTKTMVYYTTYSYREIELLAKKLASLVIKAQTSKNQAVNKKYAQSKFFKISCRPELKSSAFRKMAAS